MIHVLRKYQRPLMIVITVIIIIAFGWFFTPGSGNRHEAPAGKVRIYDRTYSQDEIDRRSRGYGVAMAAGLGKLVIGLTYGNPYGEQAASQFLVNSFILAHEAERLGIVIPDDEVAAAIQKLPAFQTNGAFDMEKYRDFDSKVLRPRGFTAERLEELVRDELRLEKLAALIGATVDVSPAEFRADFVKNTQKIDASVIRLDLAAFKAEVKPTDEEIAKVFEQRQAGYKAPEKRTVTFVKLDLPAAAKDLKGRELMDARQALANRANDFTQELLQPGATFTGVAKKYELEVKTAADFSEAEAPADFSGAPQAAEAAFRLTEKEPFSDPLPVGSGYLVLHLEKVTPSRPLTLAEAKPQVIEEIKAEKAQAALSAKGAALYTQISDALKAGKPFADAAKEAGVTSETLPPFSPAEPLTKQADAQQLIVKAVELPDGALGSFTQTPTGGFLLYVAKREAVDEAKLMEAEKDQLAQTRENKGFLAFLQWLDSRRKFANISGGERE